MVRNVRDKLICRRLLRCANRLFTSTLFGACLSSASGAPRCHFLPLGVERVINVIMARMSPISISRRVGSGLEPLSSINWGFLFSCSHPNQNIEKKFVWAIGSSTFMERPHQSDRNLSCRSSGRKMKQAANCLRTLIFVCYACSWP